MTSRTVKYFKRISETAYEPFATSKKELDLESKYQDVSWCDSCQAVIEPEGRLDSTGIYSVCPFCGEEIE